MTDPAPLDAARDADQDSDVGRERASSIGAPRWVKLTWIVVGVVAAMAMVVLLVQGQGGAGHGPAQHAPPASGTEQGVLQR